MNRRRAKELLPVIQAYAEGKTIQFALEGHAWTDVVEELALTFPAEDYDYRIKPELIERWMTVSPDGMIRCHYPKPPEKMMTGDRLVHLREVCDE